MPRAHPRSRGEHPVHQETTSGVLGSSPLARGTHNARLAAEGAPGLIPARAGNTRSTLMFERGSRAHPRSRGEHLPGCCPRGSRPGSSPLARGTPSLPYPLPGCGGLIPARAGNTTIWRRCGGGVRAHPRSRGEHCFVGLVPESHEGSSPLARGTPKYPQIRAHRRGLIPARAGNTLPTLKVPVHTRAHPRSRGEHTGNVVGLGDAGGSSPLARGTPSWEADAPEIPGLIPARAGNTRVFLRVRM